MYNRSVLPASSVSKQGSFSVHPCGCVAPVCRNVIDCEIAFRLSTETRSDHNFIITASLADLELRVSVHIISSIIILNLLLLLYLGYIALSDRVL